MTDQIRSINFIDCPANWKDGPGFRLGFGQRLLALGGFLGSLDGPELVPQLRVEQRRLPERAEAVTV